MMPRPRLWRFFDMFWKRPTDTVEVACGGVLLGLQSLWMINPRWQAIPVDIQGYLIPQRFTEPMWAAVLGTLALSQFILALSDRRSRWWIARGAVATAIAVAQTSWTLGYYEGSIFYRSVVPLLLGLVVLELWIAWRALYDYTAGRPADRFPERRHE